MPAIKLKNQPIVLESVTPLALHCVTWAMYNKLFLKILDSSIWLQPHPTRIVWFTLLAAMDEDGYAHFAAVENLAARARVTIDEAKAAIECFTSPDPDSSNPDNEGRRIERVPGGYMVLNAAAHRREFNRNIQREQTRQRVARHRLKKGVTPEDTGNGEVASNGVTAPLHTVTAPLPNVTAVYASESVSESGRKGESEGKTYSTGARVVIHYLNEKANRKFREVEDHLKIIEARLHGEGVTLEGVKTMIDRQAAIWLKDAKMVEYLTPQTLFAKCNFAKYYDDRDRPLPKDTNDKPNPRNQNCTGDGDARAKRIAAEVARRQA